MAELSVRARNRCLRVLSVLCDGYGLSEQDLLQQTGLASEDFMETLGKLTCEFITIDNVTGPFVKHFLSQEGTAGPYEHRYRLLPGISVQVQKAEDKK